MLLSCFKLSDGFTLSSEGVGYSRTWFPRPVHSPAKYFVRSQQRSPDADTTSTTHLFYTNNPQDATDKNKNATDVSSMYFIPPEQLEALREQVNIVDVIEHFNVPEFHKRSPRKAVALCPFHDDHSPSLQIDGDRGIYKCFACGAGGNVYSFVREYHDQVLNTPEEDMNFVKAVQFVRNNFAPGFSLPMDNNDHNGRRGQTRMSLEERVALQKKKDRILLANALAADFYAKQLASIKGGKARGHLTDRGLQPMVVQRFGIGYAPDAYYASTNRAKKDAWGVGSLVEYLKDQGMTPNEIVSAGLATRIQQKQPQVQLQDPSATGNSMFSSALKEKTKNEANSATSNTTATDDEEDLDYSKLIDRFRGRLMVPIFDATGKQVLGFGGRILDDDEDEHEADVDDANVKSLSSFQKSKRFVPPKYLNSPESLVFTKKNVLFGYHMVDRALPKIKKSVVPEKQPSMATVVIVEGYMDAITLWQAEITEAVACMGTALTFEQLEAAAKLVRSRGGGKVVLCLDNDKAGVNAIERLCSGKMLSTIAERHSIEFVVASLPEGIKDPADFVQQYPFDKKIKKMDTIQRSFKELVEDTAKDWTEWYIDLIMSQYNESAVRGAPGSFGNIFERVAEFLATFQNAAERIKKASEVSILFSEIMAKQNGTPTVSETVRVQLEADLVDQASRIAKSRDVVTRRLEALAEDVSDVDLQNRLTSIAQGEGIDGPDEDAKLSFKKRMEDPDFKADVKKKRAMRGQKRPSSSPRNSERRFKVKKMETPKLIDHFDGFDFPNSNDADWLGLPKQKSKRKKDEVLRLKGQNGPFGNTQTNFIKDPVYFNSNDFHGEAFLSEDAAKAGYVNDMIVPRDPDLFVKGVGTLMQRNADILSDAAEDTLLRTLVAYSSARTALKNSRDVSEASGNSGTIEWNDPAREWLFDKLINKLSDIPTAFSGPTNMLQLRSFLADSPDAPEGAFGSFRIETKIIEETRTSEQANEKGSDSYTMSLEKKDPPMQPKFMYADGMDIPEDISEIDDWAASFDPSIFDVKPEGQRPIEDQTTAGTTNKKPPPTSQAIPVRVGEIIEDGESNSTDQADSISVASAKINDLTDRVDLRGSLDPLFLLQEEGVLTVDFPDGVPAEDRAALSVQEMYTTLLWTTEVRRLARIREKLAAAASKLIELSTSTNHESKDEVSGNATDEANTKPILNRHELMAHCVNLNKQLQDSTATVQVLTESATRISQHLVQCAATNGITENRISEAQFNSLKKTIDGHLDEIHRWSVPDPDELEDDPFEDYLEQAQNEWGELYEDHRMWTVEDIVHESPPLELDPDKIENLPGFEYLFQDATENDNGESFEDAVDRIDREWALWLDDDDEGEVTIVDDPERSLR